MIAGNLGPRDDYQTVELRIRKSHIADEGYLDEDYLIDMRISGWRSFDGLGLSIDQGLLTALEADPAGYGLELGQAVFGDDACGPAYTQALAVLRGRGDGMRVRLMVDAPSLRALRWERMYQPVDGKWRPLGTTGVTPFSRFVPVQQWDRPLPITERPLRVLTVIAAPSDLDAYQLDPIDQQERQALHDLFDRSVDVQATYLESGTSLAPTLDELRRQLAQGVHMVHMLCHGARTQGGTVLYLEGSDGTVDPVTTDQLVGAFKALANPPVFCFLSACESAARERHDALTPLGPALVQDGGVQAAIAMSERVGLNTAREFADQFYQRLMSHGLVDLAVNEARALVQDKWDWGAPVLFSRLPDNQLIDFPVGDIYPGYLAHSENAYRAADEALAVARLDAHGTQLIDELEKLIQELSKSHKVLVDVASRFRRTGTDPATFSQRFEDFYYEFKDYYDSQTWVDEDTSCREIDEWGFRYLPKLRPLLDDVTFAQLQQELGYLGNADADLLRYFRAYLDTMNMWVEEIMATIGAGMVDAAIEHKREYAAQISPSFRRSKDIFERMSGSITAVAAA